MRRRHNCNVSSDACEFAAGEMLWCSRSLRSLSVDHPPSPPRSFYCSLSLSLSAPLMTMIHTRTHTHTPTLRHNRHRAIVIVIVERPVIVAGVCWRSLPPAPTTPRRPTRANSVWSPPSSVSSSSNSTTAGPKPSVNHLWVIVVRRHPSARRARSRGNFVVTRQQRPNFPDRNFGCPTNHPKIQRHASTRAREHARNRSHIVWPSSPPVAARELPRLRRCRCPCVCVWESLQSF